MNKITRWFKKHIKYEVFSFMGFIFSITVFMYNLATNQIIPMQFTLLDSETITYVDPAVLYVLYIPFIAFSLLLLTLAGICLYFLIRKP